MGKIDIAALRYNDGKPRVDLLPPDAIFGWARVMEMGARKYAERNWEKGGPWSHQYASLMRHLLAFWMGEDDDPESGLPHIDHVVWNAGALSAFQKRGIGVDDRNVLKPGTNAPNPGVRES